MTVQEAIDWLKAISVTLGKNDFHKSSVLKRKEALHRAIEALEKQVPKKPVKDQLLVEQDFITGDVTTEDVFNCPRCEGFIGYVTDCTGEYSEPYQIPYCSVCGQALKWSEEDWEEFAERKIRKEDKNGKI